MLESDRQHTRRELHSCPETMGTRCDGCLHLSCIERPTAKLHRWNYYCDLLHKRMSQKDLYSITVEMCPEHREIRRRFK